MNLFKWVIAAISMGDSHRKFSTRYSAFSHFNVGLAHLCRRPAPLPRHKGDVEMTINKHGRRSFLVLCSMTVVAADGVAANGNEEKPALEEIVVTAQLREQYLQDVPISINVLGAGEIADKKIDDISDIGYEVPGPSV